MEIYHNWWEEKRSAYLYSIMAECEQNVLHKKLFLDLNKAAEKQALSWETKMKTNHIPMPPAFKPDFVLAKTTC